MKSHKSAVVIIPPKDVWDQIQDIRRKFDKAYGRWMPHINLIYPFKPDTEFQAIIPQLQERLSSVKAFNVSMTSDAFGYFEHGQSCGMWLKPLSSKHETDGREEICRKAIIPQTQILPKLRKTVSKREVDNEKTMKISNSVYNLSESIYLNNTGSLNNLRNAVWKHGENDRITNSSTQAGLESLRDAVWKTGDIDFTFGTLSDLAMSSDLSKTVSEQNFCISQLMTDKKISEEQEVSKTDQEDILQISNTTPDPQTNDWSGYSEVIRKKKVFSLQAHPAILDLQKDLENLFPEFNDLSVINKCGFKPHLTLAQFKKSEIQEVLDEFKKKWTPIHFLVSEIYVISRLGFDDKFEIRKSIPLNG